MKKLAAFLFLALVVLLVAAEALGQEVGASRIKRKTDGGLVADSANALAVGLKRSTTAPASPVAGQLWLDTSTTPATLRSWNGSSWEISPTAAANVLAGLSSLPASPSDGQIVWVSGLKRAIVYDSADATWYYLDAKGRRATSSYSLEAAGYSSSFLTAPASAPTVAVGTGTSTAGTHVCAVTYLNSTGGETLPGPSSGTVTTTAAQGIAVSNIPTGGAGVAGRRIYCSEAGTTTPLFLAGTLADNSTTAFTVGTATNAAFVHAAPDVDFSAPIPSGWTARLPNGNDLSYGGCGSTGTSLLCASYAFTAANLASTNGVRLTYQILDGSGDWMATLRLLRASVGFTGSQAVWSRGNVVGYAAAANNVDAPETRGIGTNTTGSSATYSNGWLGYSASTLSRFERAPGGVWSTSLNQPAPYLLDWAYPFWLRFSSASDYTNRWEIAGAPGKFWSTFSSTGTSPPTYFPHVGISLELAGTGGTTGAVIEIDSFTVEPW